MAAGHCNPTPFPRSPPFRATQLWNEAVDIFQNGMPTRRHFHRMRYYDHCFSGKEAIEWLSHALIVNPRFGNNVTVEGTQKLLQHFLKSGVFQSIKGILTFKESGLYEFVNRTIQSPNRKQERKVLPAQKCLKEIDFNVPKSFHHGISRKKEDFKNNRLYTNNKSEYFSYQDDIDWKDIILKRIGSLLPTLGIDLLLDPGTISSDWVKVNVCPQYQSVRNNTELPFWVFTAISSVINPLEKEYPTYQGYQKQVYKVVQDYLRHRNIPVIPYCLYELVMYTFNHLHYTDLELKNRLKERDSVENLVLSMSNADWSSQELVSNENLATTMLPPNSCFETAFTSDEPVTRIVPQSCVDTICLSNRNPVNNNRDISYPQVKHVENSGICDKFRRKCNNRLRRTQSMAQIDIKWSSPSQQLTDQQSYVNYGLSQSLDDLLLDDVTEDVAGSLDLEEAMKSVHSLMRATTVSDSFDSLTTVDSCIVDPADLVCIDSCQWLEDVQTTAKSVFQLLLLLLPPVSRTSLRMLLQFIDRLCFPSHSTISKTEVVYDLSAHILSPGAQSKNVYSHHMVLSVVYFLVDNCNFIFQDISVKELLNGFDRRNRKENMQTQVYCEQVTGAQFQDQGVTSSWLALAELLDQIISDTKMKPKEKKKRLKKFKEAYPHIYKQKLGSSSTSSALLHFR